MSSRRYVKRIWRVPKTRGPVEYLATLIVKALVKHGWPATWDEGQYDPWAFWIRSKDVIPGDEPPSDFANAVEIACRIIARTYKVDVSVFDGYVKFNRPYVVSTAGHFREVKP